MRTKALAFGCAVLLSGSCDRVDSATARAAAVSVERGVKPGMSISDVVDLAAGKEIPFRVLGFCGAEGGLNIRGEGDVAEFVAWRGSPSGNPLLGPVEQEHRFPSHKELQAALDSWLLKDGPCSRLSVGFQGTRGWQVLQLAADGSVERAEPTREW